jgi:hypothetical protein
LRLERLRGRVFYRQGAFRRPPFCLLLILFLFSSISTRPSQEWIENFDKGGLDSSRWVVTSEGDFRERMVDVVDVGRRGSNDFRLRIRADTVGTRDDAVKFLGVRSSESIRLEGNVSISVVLDWNDQANGSYLSAALILSPEATTGNALNGSEWFKFGYVGVPPGRNARAVLSVKTSGRERTLYTEGWPDSNREGRKISLQKIEVLIRRQSFQIMENDRLLYDSGDEPLPIEHAYLYLQMSSHSNYPAREIYFDDVRVKSSR